MKIRRPVFWSHCCLHSSVFIFTFILYDFYQKDERAKPGNLLTIWCCFSAPPLPAHHIKVSVISSFPSPFLHSSTLLRLTAAYPHAPLCPLLHLLHSQRAILFTFTRRTSGHCLETFRALDFPVPRNNNNNNNNGDDEGILHTKAGANRLYIERRSGGRRLVELESARNAAIVGLSECIMVGKDRLTIFV